MNYLQRITTDHKVMLGKPIIKGTRITVEQIIKKLSEGANIEALLEIYPQVKEEDIYACLYYASEVIAKEEII